MSKSAAPEPKEIARQLLAYEVASTKTPDAENSAAFRVCEQLRGPLGKIMGGGGFRSVLSRALALACADVPWLCAIQIWTDGSLHGLDELEAKLEPAAVAEGEVVLVGYLLGVLVTFIGPALTLELLHDIWPKAGRSKFQKEERYEAK